MKFSIGGQYDVSSNTFWKHVFFRDDFTEALYAEGLGFESIDVLDASTNEGGDRTRHLRVQPRLNIPKLIRRRIGERLTYIEAGYFDSTLEVWKTDIRLGGWEDKVKVYSEMSFSDIGPNHSRRQVDFHVEAHVLGVGGLVERFLEKTLRESYEKARIMTNTWISTHLSAELRRSTEYGSP